MNFRTVSKIWICFEWETSARVCYCVALRVCECVWGGGLIRWKGWRKMERGVLSLRKWGLMRNIRGFGRGARPGWQSIISRVHNTIGWNIIYKALISLASRLSLRLLGQPFPYLRFWINKSGAAVAIPTSKLALRGPGPLLPHPHHLTLTTYTAHSTNTMFTLSLLYSSWQSCHYWFQRLLSQSLSGRSFHK